MLGDSSDGSRTGVGRTQSSWPPWDVFDEYLALGFCFGHHFKSEPVSGWELCFSSELKKHVYFITEKAWEQSVNFPCSQLVLVSRLGFNSHVLSSGSLFTQVRYNFHCKVTCYTWTAHLPVLCVSAVLCFCRCVLNRGKFLLWWWHYTQLSAGVGNG